jgi:hypothetical protein
MHCKENVVIWCRRHRVEFVEGELGGKNVRVESKCARAANAPSAPRTKGMAGTEAVERLSGSEPASVSSKLSATLKAPAIGNE